MQEKMKLSNLVCSTSKSHDLYTVPGYSVYEPYAMNTVNQLNFAAVKFRRLPIFLYFAHFNFAFWYLRIFPDKNVTSQKCL